MQTNQLMTIDFGAGRGVEVWHKSKEVLLNDIFRLGNIYRASQAKPAGQMHQFLKREDTKSFIEAYIERLGKNPVRKEGEGRSTKHWVALPFAIMAAEYLSSELRLDVILKMIDGEILEQRDRSGDAHNELVSVLEQQYGLSTADMTNVMSNISMVIQNVIQPQNCCWNQATREQLRERTKMLEAIAASVRMFPPEDPLDLIKAMPKLVKSLGISPKPFNPDEPFDI